KFLTRVWRILSDGLKAGERTREMARLPHIGETLARNSPEPCASADRLGHQPLPFIRYAVKLVAHTDVERESGTDFPIVFDERTPLILMPVFQLPSIQRNLPVVRKRGIFGVHDLEPLANTVH